MIRSMTGYAAMTRELPQGLLQLELRTVNGRYLDMQFRLAEEFRWCEPQLRELASGALARGKLDCRLSFTSASLVRSGAALDTELLEHLARLSAEVQIGRAHV